MNPNQTARLQKRAIRAGVKKARKEGHALDEREVLGLKVQVISAWWRWLLGLTGMFLILSGAFEWLTTNNLVQGLEIMGGILLVFFGIVGVRRTLSEIADAAVDTGIGDLIEGIISAIGDAVDL